MMQDLISKQAEINAIKELCEFYDVEFIFERIEALLSAQPEPSTEIQKILEYLDTTLHPIVSPDNWNVYAELHDMVSKLSSAQPEPQWIPVSERLPDEEHYPDDDEDISEWVLVTLKSIQTGERYMDIARTANGKWEMLHADFDGDFLCKDVPYWADIVAWMPLPESYQGGEDSAD